ncbi:amidohydrolase family protein [Dawidia soli]|uniref:Amidohydrolase family protein n=1 Tax=Dawidia soli TaxID=2782352 RepID=A0AAP2DBI8_9BACT|nr:amidohydrolase family protein [Dawidia soli]MBT1687880.1 amidohydrolase family protein [Dawidia soli]
MKTPYVAARLSLALVWLLIAGPLLAQEERELLPVTGTYAITHVTIIQSPGRIVDKGTVVIKDGLIKAVGKNIPVPPEAMVLKGDSLYVYAGFIDGLSHAGVNKPNNENRDRVKDPGNPPPDRAGITPQTDVRNFLNPADKAVEELRAIGFTTAHVVPHGGMLPGAGALVWLGGRTADDMVLQPQTSFFSTLATADRIYPVTVIGVMAKWRELYRQAVQAKGYATTYASARNGMKPAATDRVLEAFYPVIDKKMPVLFQAEKALDVHRVLDLQKGLGFPLVVAEVKEGWDVAPKLKAANAKVFLSLQLPEEKKEEKKDEPLKSMSAQEKEALDKRKTEFTAKYTGQAVAFQKAGVPFGFSALQVKTGDIRGNLRKIIKAGLTEDQALAALTTTPAQLLGVSDMLGSVDAGKVANLVVTRKPYFDEKSVVHYVFVNGILYKMDLAAAKKEAAKVALEGEWTVTSETPQGKTEALLTIKKEGAQLGGTVSGDFLPQPVTLTTLMLEGNVLKFSFTMNQDGRDIKVEVEAKVEGTTFKGEATLDTGDKLPVQGQKKPKP